MLLVLENEVDPAYRYFVPAMREHLPATQVHDVVADGARPDLDGVDGVIIAGSTAGVYEADAHAWMAEEAALVRELVETGVPTLGVCFGHQLVNEALGGRVEHRGLTAELVDASLADDPLLEGVGPVLPALHGDHVVEAGDGLEPLVEAPHCPRFGTRHRDAPVWTVQFHPEFTRSLLPRIREDFGWSGPPEAFEAVSAHRVLGNFARLAREADRGA